jgi:poly-beta-1,6-N-acetyl-D-glucosamine synthase
VLTYALLTDSVGLALIWTLVGAFFVLERAWSVKRGGWRSVAVSALVVPEVVYDLFLHAVYVRAAIDTATSARESWDYKKPLEASRLRWWRRCWDRIVVAGYAGIGIAAVVGLAFACIAVGLGWLVIAALVLGGTARAALRLTGLYPLGLILDSGENAELDGSPASKPQGFGGIDVPVNAASPAHEDEAGPEPAGLGRAGQLTPHSRS